MPSDSLCLPETLAPLRQPAPLEEDSGFLVSACSSHPGDSLHPHPVGPGEKDHLDAHPKVQSMLFPPTNSTKQLSTSQGRPCASWKIFFVSYAFHLKFPDWTLQPFSFSLPGTSTPLTSLQSGCFTPTHARELSHTSHSPRQAMPCPKLIPEGHPIPLGNGNGISLRLY